MTRADLLVIGAGPYAYSAAAYARENGIDTHVVGQPMSFWRDQMPSEMFLRSGPDWHLDGSGEHTFEADKVLAPPGIRHFVNLPGWYDDVPEERRSHTADLCDHGAAGVDVVHRHDTPDFAKVSWAFADDYVDQTLAHPGVVARSVDREAASGGPGVLAGWPADAGALAGAAEMMR